MESENTKTVASWVERQVRGTKKLRADRRRTEVRNMEVKSWHPAGC